MICTKIAKSKNLKGSDERRETDIATVYRQENEILIQQVEGAIKRLKKQQISTN